jgi:hypothetical protein
MKQKLTHKKNATMHDFDQFAEEIKFTENEGTQTTSVKIKVSVILTVPICVTKAYFSLGNLTDFETIEVMDVRKDTEQTM